MKASPQLGLDLPLAASARTADDFLVAASNEMAVRTINHWPHWPQGRMALAGPAGCGKSHLAQIWCKRARALPVSMEELATIPAAELLARAPALVIDPLAPETMPETTPAGHAGIPETALLHLLNYASECRQGVLLVARTPPARWPVALPDLSSRLNALPLARIGAPDDALLEAMIVKLFCDRQLAVAPGLPSWLVQRIERSGAAAAAIVARLDAAALACKQPVSLAMARSLLESPAP